MQSPTEALEAFFSDLLDDNETPQPAPNPTPQVKTEPRTEVNSLERGIVHAELEQQQRQQLQRLLDRQAEQALQTSAPAISVQEAPSKPQETPVAQEQMTTPEPAVNSPPAWGEAPFEALLFDVCGLTLAVPLVALGQIVPINKKITRLHGQSEWFIGILPSNIGDIRMIDTALFVMPERYEAHFRDQAKYAVTIDGLPWGLAVDGVRQPMTLDPADVKWRGDRSKRPWLAGTVKTHMCALIDIQRMAQMLESADT